MSELFKDKDKLYTFLLNAEDPRYYSYEIQYTSKITNISIRKLHLYQRRNDDINIFTYNDVTYIGLECERLRYEKDKINGVNHVEHLIAKGKYL